MILTFERLSQPVKFDCNAKLLNFVTADDNIFALQYMNEEFLCNKV